MIYESFNINDLIICGVVHHTYAIHEGMNVNESLFIRTLEFDG